MTSLQNLIPAPSTKGLFMCRPAAIREPGFINMPGAISITRVFGDNVYGMSASGRFPGFDEPWCYNLLTNQMVSVSGVTANNVPTSPLISGAWTPPQITPVGGKLVITHPGFSGAFGAFFGFWDLTNPLIPVWGAGNCTGANFAGFTVPPTGVAQLSGRAYFIHNLPAQPAVIFSNVNDPLHNSDTPVVPVLTFGDNQTLTAIAGLPLSNQLGGIIQSLMVFKDASNIMQITGDATGNPGPLAVNSLNVPTGTLAPASVVPTPKGLGFVSPDGFRIIDWDARITDPIGMDGSGVTLPFIYAITPSRMTATCNGEVYRISVQNGLVPGQSVQVVTLQPAAVGTNTIIVSNVTGFSPGMLLLDTTNSLAIPPGTVITNITGNVLTLSNSVVSPGVAASDQIVVLTNQGYQEWWYDFGRQIWTGPHTSVMSSISPYKTTFIGTLRGVPGQLWQTDYLQSSTSTFVENGQQMTVNHQTVLLPDNDMIVNAVTTQTTLDLSMNTGQLPVVINAVDQNAIVLTSATIVPPDGAPLWGQVTWGSFNWGGVQTGLAPRIIPWSIPVAFTRLSLQATTSASFGLRMGTWHLRYKPLRYEVDLTSSLPATVPAGPLFILDQSQLGGTDVLG
jgi:hypothetical protein